MSVRVFLSAGEASGDAYAAALVRELRRQSMGKTIYGQGIQGWIAKKLAEYPDKDGSADSLAVIDLVMAFEDEFGVDLPDEAISTPHGLQEVVERNPAALMAIREQATGDLEFAGVGGLQMEGEGVRLVADSSTWGAIGFVQAARVYARAKRGFKAAEAAIKTREPGLFIPIDFGFFNIRLAKIAKARGWKVLYFVPPGSWRKDRQGADLPAITDVIVTPFPWSAEILEGMGANVHWFGHPLKQLIRDAKRQHPVRDAHTLAILPGSRKHEVELNLPKIALDVQQLARDLPDLRIEFAVATSLSIDYLREFWRRHAPDRGQDRFTQGENARVLLTANAAVVCSGTATLEAALCECPTVVVYDVSPGMAFQGYLIHGKPKYIALPNILLDRFAVPELVHFDVKGPKIAAALNRIWRAGEPRRDQLLAFRELDGLTGSDDAISRAAELALEMLT